jgi:hypothetical protein
MPQFRIDGVLRCQGTVEGAIFLPSARNVTEIALSATLSADASAPSQGFDGDVIQALALLPRAPTESSV